MFSSKEVQWGCLETAAAELPSSCPRETPFLAAAQDFSAPRNLLLDIASGSPAVGPQGMRKSVDFTARKSMTVHEIMQPISLSVLA